MTHYYRCRCCSTQLSCQTHQIKACVCGRLREYVSHQKWVEFYYEEWSGGAIMRVTVAEQDHLTGYFYQYSCPD